MSQLSLTRVVTDPNSSDPLTINIWPSEQRRYRGFRVTGETRHVSEASWRHPYQKLKSLQIWPTIFRDIPISLKTTAASALSNAFPLFSSYEICFEDNLLPKFTNIFRELSDFV